MCELHQSESAAHALVSIGLKEEKQGKKKTSKNGSDPGVATVSFFSVGIVSPSRRSVRRPIEKEKRGRESKFLSLLLPLDGDAHGVAPVRLRLREQARSLRRPRPLRKREDREAQGAVRFFSPFSIGVHFFFFFFSTTSSDFFSFFLSFFLSPPVQQSKLKKNTGSPSKGPGGPSRPCSSSTSTGILTSSCCKT